MSIRNLLSSLGHRPFDAGNEWRCQAVYRGGDSPNSLSVNKRNGLWFDYPAQTGGSLQELVELTLHEEIEDFEKFVERYDIDFSQLEEERPTIMSEKIWPKEELDKLLPHYRFYEDRGISKETLQLFKGGFQHSGTMNRRFVFPIYNKDGQIHGWTGRDMTESRDVKWYHLGKTRDWVYPFYVRKGSRFPCQEAIREKGFVILVESVGDMLALWEHGYKNVLVTFGVKVSPTLSALLMGLGVKIVISTNNDIGKKENWGRKGALDVFIRLLSHIDYQNMIIALPAGTNDFGDQDHDFEKWEKKIESPKYQAIHKAVLERMSERYKEGKLSKTAIKMGKAIADEYNVDING